MTREETIKWLESLKSEIGKSEHRALWHYAEAIDTAIESLQTEADCSTCRHNDKEWYSVECDSCCGNNNHYESADAETMTEEVREALMRLTMCAREECVICKYKDKCNSDFQYEESTKNMNTVLDSLMRSRCEVDAKSAEANHESCEDCPLYDTEKHSCPRFNKVIPRTIAETVQGEWIEQYASKERTAKLAVCSECRRLLTVSKIRKGL